MADESDIAEASAALGDAVERTVLLQCVSEYPAEVEHINLRAIASLRRQFRSPVGLSDHTTGVITAVAGAVLGACVGEKHVTLSRAMPGTDHAAALEEEGQRRLVQYIRTCERAMGDGRKPVRPVVDAARQS